MVEVRDDPGFKEWTKSVFIDGKQLRLQCCEDPTIEGKMVIVRCLTDKRLATPLDPKSVPKKYQVKPYTKSIGDGIRDANKDMEITTFYLQMSANP